MAGLTAPPDNSAQSAGQTIAADGWFPPVDTAKLAARVRIGEGVVTLDRQVDAITGAILSGLREMSAWRSAHAGAGIADLESVTDDEVAGQNAAVLLWERIVIFFAAADLIDSHVDVSATDDALDRHEEKRDSAADYRRRAYAAVADLRAIGPHSAGDHGRNRVELL